MFIIYVFNIFVRIKFVVVRGQVFSYLVELSSYKTFDDKLITLLKVSFFLYLLLNCFFQNIVIGITDFSPLLPLIISCNSYHSLSIYLIFVLVFIILMIFLQASHFSLLKLRSYGCNFKNKSSSSIYISQKKHRYSGISTKFFLAHRFFLNFIKEMSMSIKKLKIFQK